MDYAKWSYSVSSVRRPNSCKPVICFSCICQSLLTHSHSYWLAVTARGCQLWHQLVSSIDQAQRNNDIVSRSSFKYDCLSTFSSFMFNASLHLPISAQSSLVHQLHQLILLSSSSSSSSSSPPPGLDYMVGFILLLIGADGPNNKSPCGVQAPKTLSSHLLIINILSSSDWSLLMKMCFYSAFI